MEDRSGVCIRQQIVPIKNVVACISTQTARQKLVANGLVDIVGIARSAGAYGFKMNIRMKSIMERYGSRNRGGLDYGRLVDRIH